MYVYVGGGGGGVLFLVFRGKTKDVVIDHERRLGD